MFGYLDCFVINRPLAGRALALALFLTVKIVRLFSHSYFVASLVSVSVSLYVHFSHYLLSADWRLVICDTRNNNNNKHSTLLFCCL